MDFVQLSILAWVILTLIILAILLGVGGRKDERHRENRD